jgi:hypothetical protein
VRLWQILRGFLRRLAGTGPGFLCDDCRYNYGSSCSRPERPNARVCPDYKRR